MICSISKNKVKVAMEPYLGLLIVDEWIYKPKEGKMYWRDYVFEEELDDKM